MTAPDRAAAVEAASVAVEHSIVDDAIAEFLDSVGLPDVGLPSYGIRKVAAHAALVARAQALGMNPDELRPTEDEQSAEHIRRLREALGPGRRR